MRHFIAFCTFLMLSITGIASLHGQAQVPPNMGLNPDRLLSQYVHDIWNEDQGVPQSTIESIVQTQDGFIWIGTQRGLVRFDGQSFNTFDYVNTDAIRGGNKVQALHVDMDGSLWIGLSTGLAIYNDGVFTNVADSLDLNLSSITDIEGDPTGGIWIATARDGLFVARDGRIDKVDTALDLEQTPITAILPNQDGSVWLGTEKGLYLERNGTVRPFGIDHGLGDTNVTTLYKDRTGAVWVGSFDGIHVFRGESWIDPPVARLKTLRAEQFLEDVWGSVWIATATQGLFRLTGTRLEQLEQSGGLTHNQVESLFQDREGSLWIGTNGGGLNRLRDGKFFTLSMKEGLPSDMIFTVFEDSRGAMWFGTESNGVIRKTGVTIDVFSTADGLTTAESSSFAETPDGTIWIATYGGGLHSYRNGKFSRVEGLTNDFIAALYADREGSLWVGTNDGLFHITHDGHIRHYTTEDGLFNHYITAIKQDQDGTLWVGNWEGGLHKLVGDRFTHLDTIHGLPGDTPVMDILIDSENTLWAATYGRGLVRIRDDQARIFTLQDGLYDELIYVVLEADDGSLWMTCDNGIFRIDKSDFDALDRGELDQLTASIFTKSDGLRSKEMNGGLQPAGWKSRDGRLWFPSIKGVAMIDPLRVPRNEMPPPVEITRFMVNGTERAFTDGIVFDPGVERIEFSFAALSFLSPEQNEYEYQLFGYDDEPTRLSFDPEVGSVPPAIAVYTNLPNGEYTFQVRASNNDGVWNRIGAQQTFSIRPHFTATMWFRILVGLSALGLLIGAWRLRTLQMERRQRALEQERDKAREANRFKTLILDNLNHEFRTPLTGILGYADLLRQDMSGEQEEFLGYIKSNGKRLLSTLDSLLELARVQNESHDFERDRFDLNDLARDVLEHYDGEASLNGMELTSELPPHPVNVILPGHAFQYVLSALLSNALKFNRGTSIHVTLRVRDDRNVEVLVIDQGPGIPGDAWEDIFLPFKQLSEGLTRSHEGTGVGLTIARHLMRTMDGELGILESSKSGTTMQMLVPVAHVPGSAPLWKQRTDRSPTPSTRSEKELASEVGS